MAGKPARRCGPSPSTPPSPRRCWRPWHRIGWPSRWPPAANWSWRPTACSGNGSCGWSARYEAQRAERQYQAVEPENRLVARNLERQWETALRAVEQLAHEQETWSRQQAVTVTAADRAAILALGQDLPALWHAPTTTPADRKRLLRLVVREVLLDQHRGRGQVWMQINWQTGAQTEHWVTRRVRSYAAYVDGERLQQRLRELAAAAYEDDEIAETLNRERFRTARGPLI